MPNDKTTDAPRTSRETTPHRVQRSRAKGWRMPENAVCVSRPSKWSNPYIVTQTRNGQWWIDCCGDMAGPFSSKSDAAAQAVAEFRVEVSPLHADIRSELRGKNLACWCALNEPCHADVLLELANG
jgi:hypothetical protein